MQCCDQWRITPTGHIYGIDIQAVLSIIQLHTSKKRKQKQLWHDIQVMARAAQSTMSERDE